MTIDEIKTALDAFVLAGGKVDELTGSDKLYRQIKDSDIFENGKRLTTAEKFARAGHSRQEKVSPLQKITNLIDAHIAAGGKLEDIKKGTQLYADIKNTYVVLENGRRATMQEKFTLAGHERRPRRAVSIDEIARRLQEFIDAGGNVDELGVDDELYQLVKQIDNKHTLEEKFKMCGQVRHAKKSNDVWEDLSREAHTYVAEGKSLHIERKKLPFYEKLHAAKRSYFRRYGKKITSKEALERVGVKGYSDIYYNFQRIFELEKFKDVYGNVDDYRKDLFLNATIDRYAEALDMPISLVVLLVANQNLEKTYLQTDTISYISKQLHEFQADYGSFEHISQIDPQLYNRLCRLKRIVKTDSGKPVSTKELVEMLGAQDTQDTFADYTEIREPDYDEDIAPLVEIAKSNGGNLGAKNIPAGTYRMLLDYATRNNTTIKDVFAEFGVNYIDAKPNKTFVKICVDSFPYIHEMRDARDKIAEQIIISHPEYTKEEVFEEYLKICQAVYQEFKPLIENFGLNEGFDSSKLKRTNPSTLGD